MLASPYAFAGGLDTSLNLTPDLLSVEMKPAEGEGVQEARFGSGMGLQLSSGLFQFAVDYRVESEFAEEADTADVSQKVGAVFHSDLLNKLLGLNADIRAGSTVREGGDAYLYSITPGFSKPLAELGKLDIHYEYLLDKPSADAAEQEKTGYSMGLEGGAGLLSWKGKYRSTDVFGGVEQLQSTQLMEFESGLQLAPELRFELSGKSSDEVRYDGGRESDLFTETRYGAGVAWSPSRQYSVAFKVNKLHESRDDQEEVFGSGTVSWFPRRDMEFTLSYGDHLVEGARGLMLSTRIDLNGS
jgi:hypothetical protein